MATNDDVYTVPLTAFAGLFQSVDVSLHGELAERLRAEIHGDIVRRRTGHRVVGTAMGREIGGVETVVAGGDIVVHGGGDATVAGRRPRASLSSRQAPASVGDVVIAPNRYPGGGGGLAASVNAVLAQASVLAREFRGRSSDIAARRRYGREQGARR